MIIRGVALFLTLWFGAVMLVSFIRGQATHWFNIAMPAASLTVLIASFGWLWRRC